MFEERDMRLISLVLAMLILLGIVSCGGSGSGFDVSAEIPSGSEPAASSNTSASDEMATVTLLLTDHPTDRFDNIVATVEDAYLLSENGDQVMLFSDARRVDLLSLKNIFEVFSVTEGIPPGEYNKIRLQISSLELIVRDDEGEISEVIYPKLPAGVHIDLNPRGTFSIAPGDSILVKLDFDVEKSIKLKGTGNGGYRFRPIIFVDIAIQGEDEDPEPGKLVRFQGEIKLIDLENNRLQLCSTQDFVTGAEVETPVCIDAALRDDTAIYNSVLQKLLKSELVLDEPARVHGLLNDATEDQTWWLDAVVIEVGAFEDFAERKGKVVETPLDNVGQFTLQTREADDGNGTFADVTLLEGAKIFGRDGSILTVSDLVLDINVTASGVLTLPVVPEVNEKLSSTLVIVEPEDLSTTFDGIITQVTSAARQLDIMVGDNERCAVANDETQFFHVTDDVFNELTFDQLMLKDSVEIYGEGFDDNLCLIATKIIVLGADDDEHDIKRKNKKSAYIPKGHLPPPGKCRLWFDDRPPGHQPPPGNCEELEIDIPENAILVKG